MYLPCNSMAVVALASPGRYSQFVRELRHEAETCAVLALLHCERYLSSIRARCPRHDAPTTCSAPHGTQTAVSGGSGVRVRVEKVASCDPSREYHLAVNNNSVRSEHKSFCGETP